MKQNLLKTAGMLLMMMFVGSAWGQTTVSYDFSAGGAVSGLDEASPGITLDANIGFGSFKNSGTSNPVINTGQLRLYQNTTKGGSIKIYASNSVTITSVVVYASGTTGPGAYSEDGVGSTAISISGGAYTMSGLSATSEVEFWCTGSSSGTRIYVDDFEVTYASGGPADPAVFTATPSTTSQINLSATANNADDNIVVAYNSENTFGTPTGTYNATDPITGGGTVLYVGASASLTNHTGLSAGQTVYYKAWSVDGTDYSLGVTADATTLLDEPSNHATDFLADVGSPSYSSIDIIWTDAIGDVLPIGYLIKGSDVGFGSIVAPSDANPESDGGLVFNVAYGEEVASFTDLNTATTYYFKIWPYTNSGANIDYKTDGTVPSISATTDEAPSIIAPTVGVVFISEICDASDFNYEFMELYNNSENIINLAASKLVRYSSDGITPEYVYDFVVDGSGDTQIPANGIIIIARGATKSEFESEWGALPSSVSFNEGNEFLYFGSSRQWVFRYGGTENTNDGTIIDETNRAMTDGAGDFQYPTNTWNTESEAIATPGSIPANQDPASYLWDGGASTTNWSDANNWNPNQVPGTGTNVTIDAGKTSIEIASNTQATCYNLTVDGSLTIKSTESSTGSLLINGSYSGTGTVTVERNINGYTSSINGWHLLSSPTDNFTVSGSSFEPSSVQDEEDDFYYWDNAEGDAGMWMNWKASNFNLAAGKGYLVAYKATEVKNFVGAPYNADISLSNLSFANASPTYNNTWHLLGNPYTCALKWNNSNGWSLNNIGGVAKVMDAANGSYNDVAAGGSIPAMQGFFVEVINAANSMTIPLAAREHSSQNWYKSQEGKLVLVANDLENNLAQTSVISINNQTNGGYDYRFDSRFLGFYAPQFYSKKDGQQLSTNAFTELRSDLSIPMGFIKNEASDFNIELQESIGSTDVYLTDLKLNHVVKLSQELIYNFTSEEGDDPDRFKIHFGVVGLDESPEFNQINAYVYNNSLYVQSQLDNVQMALYDIQGRQMFAKQLNGTGLHKTELNLPTGIYIVRLQSNNQVKNVKVFIN